MEENVLKILGYNLNYYAMDILLPQPVNIYWAPSDKVENGIIPALKDITF